MVIALHITQDDAGLLFCESALLVCDQLVVHQDPSGLVCRASFQQVGPWCMYMVPVFILLHSSFQDFAFPLIKIHDVPFEPTLQLAKVAHGTTTMWCFSCSSQFGIIWELAEVHSVTSFQVISEAVKQY